MRGMKKNVCSLVYESRNLDVERWIPICEANASVRKLLHMYNMTPMFISVTKKNVAQIVWTSAIVKLLQDANTMTSTINGIVGRNYCNVLQIFFLKKIIFNDAIRAWEFTVYTL